MAERPRVKICGITRPEDAVACRRLGADYLGLILNRGPRRVDLGRATEIRQAVPDAPLVGVFVDASEGEILAAAEALGLALLQLHGSESPRFCETLRRRARSRTIKVFGPEADVRAATGYDRGADFWLFDLDKRGPQDDAARDRLWQSAERSAAAGRRVFLAGGLSPANVAQAVRRVRPWAVDVCRGVESGPGEKDPRAVERFLQEVSDGAS